MTGLTISSNSATGFPLIDTTLNAVTVAANVTLGNTGLPALYATKVAAWTILNSGTLVETGSGTNADGILLTSTGGTVTNTAAGSIAAYNAGVSISGTGTVVNSGTIVTGNTIGSGYFYPQNVPLTATTAGVILGDGVVSNTSAGLITSYFIGVAIAAGGSIANAGTISGTGTRHGFGIVLPNGGSVSNAANGVVSGAVDAILALRQAATVVNQGLVSGASAAGIYLFAGGNVTNTSGATISGGVDGIIAKQTVSTVINQGSISGAANYGIFIGGGGIVSNASTGSILGAKSGIKTGGTTAVTIENAAGGTISGAKYAVYLGALSSGTVVNYGVLRGTSVVGAALVGGGSITNAAGGQISGNFEAIFTGGAAPSTVVNAGTLTGVRYNGAFLSAGGSLTNSGSASIAGNSFGVLISGATGTVVNSGTISSSAIYPHAHLAFNSAGVKLGNGGVVTNSSGGTISSKWKGVAIYGAAGTVINQGTILAADNVGDGAAVWINAAAVITNSASAVISGGGFGIVTYNQTTLVNQGTIFALAKAFDAVNAGFANRIIDLPGGVFSGIVDGGNTIGSSIVSTLELASGASTGTIANAGTFIGFGQIAIDIGATWSVGGSIVAGETIAFGGANAELILTSPAAVAATIAGFGPTDKIVLSGITDVTGLSFGAGNVLTVAESTGPGLTFNFNAQPALTFSAVNGSTEITVIPCFLPGTRILTGRGEVAVETLVVGDIIVTRNGRTRPLCWIGQGRTMVAPGRRSAATPVIVRKGALADNVPNQDLHITKGHSLYLNDVLIPVEFLVNHRSILWNDNAREVTVYHLELDEHAVLFANGAEAESYRDDGNRWLFQNANDGWGQPAKPPCAPVLTGGAVVDAIWQAILDRSGPRPGLPLTDDPDLHLMVDGMRVDAAERHDGVRVFRVAGRPESVHIASREAVPAELGVARDPRPLGVALRQIAVRQGTRFVVLRADDARLMDGFHAYEAAEDLRWTNGYAALPAEMFARFDGDFEIVLHVVGMTRYPQIGADAKQLAA